MIDDVIQRPLFLSLNGGWWGGLALTSIDGYDSENLSVCEMKPSEEGERQAKEINQEPASISKGLRYQG